MKLHLPKATRQLIHRALREAGSRRHVEAWPEHLLLAILAGLTKSDRSRLAASGVPVDQVESEIARMLVDGNGNVTEAADRLSPPAVAVVETAAGIAERAHDDELNLKHLLIALASCPQTLAYDAIRARGISPEILKSALDRLPTSQPPPGGLHRIDSLNALIGWLTRAPRLAYQIFIRRSLAHPSFVTNPYPLYRWLQAHEPVRQDPLAPVWILTRYDDVALSLRDPRFRKDPFADERLPRRIRQQLQLPGEAARSGVETVSMLFLDPPQHTRVRAMFSRAFSPRVIDAMRPRIEQITAKRLDRARERGQLEIIADLAYPLPVAVIAELLGFPPEDYERIKRWSDDMAAALSLRPSADAQFAAALARDELREYFDRLVPKLKGSSQENLVSLLLATEHVPDALNREEIFSNAVLLLAAGHETTTNLIGNGMLALLRHPDQLALLRKEPRLMESAVEEILRYDSPVQWTSRVAGEPMTIGGKSIEPGQLVLGCLGAANRDPKVFENPDQFDIRRSPNRHIAFGQGPHFCLGATLARMEASIAIRQLLERFPVMHLKTTRLPRIKGLTFRGVRQLPVTT